MSANRSTEIMPRRGGKVDKNRDSKIASLKLCPPTHGRRVSIFSHKAEREVFFVICVRQATLQRDAEAPAQARCQLVGS